MSTSSLTKTYHIPVMLSETVDHLVTDSDGIYIDATLGGGGHAASILDTLSTEAKLFAVDQDDEALQEARQRLGEDARITFVKGNFGYLSTLIPPEYHSRIDGILMDLGVSSHQLDTGERGFSFQQDGPLDMRMSNLRGLDAGKVVNQYDYYRLRDIIFHYGEEKMSRQIARAIVQARPLSTTGELADVVRSTVTHPHQQKTLARVFQAIRIEVNRELEMLRSALYQSIDLLKPGGRLVVLSYHSLEDRQVKRFMKTGNTYGTQKKDFYGNVLRPIRPLIKNVIKPGQEEVDQNPAARSARLRVGERLEYENEEEEL